jgi:surface antigen
MKESDIDVASSTMEVSYFDQSSKGLQTVQISLSLIPSSTNTNANATAITYSEKAAIKMTGRKKPQIILKSDKVTIDLGSTFNYTDNIGYITSATGVLPASIQESDNVDVNTEGTYTVTLSVADGLSTGSTVSYTVEVKKPAEVVRAEEEAARKQQEEEEQKKQEEEAKAAEEETAQTETAAASTDTSGTLTTSANITYAGTADHATGDSGNAYPWGQCTWYAYERRHQLGLPCGSYFGNAGAWAASAASYGYAVDSNPQVGDVVVFAPGQAGASAFYGHVAVVEAVEGDSIVISESNARGLGVISTRTVSNASAYEYIHN